MFLRVGVAGLVLLFAIGAYQQVVKSKRSLPESTYEEDKSTAKGSGSFADVQVHPPDLNQDTRKDTPHDKSEPEDDAAVNSDVSYHSLIDSGHGDGMGCGRVGSRAVNPFHGQQSTQSTNYHEEFGRPPVTPKSADEAALYAAARDTWATGVNRDSVANDGGRRSAAKSTGDSMTSGSGNHMSDAQFHREMPAGHSRPARQQRSTESPNTNTGSTGLHSYMTDRNDPRFAES